MRVDNRIRIISRVHTLISNGNFNTVLIFFRRRVSGYWWETLFKNVREKFKAPRYNSLNSGIVKCRFYRASFAPAAQQSSKTHTILSFEQKLFPSMLVNLMFDIGKLILAKS